MVVQTMCVHHISLNESLYHQPETLCVSKFQDYRSIDGWHWLVRVRSALQNLNIIANTTLSLGLSV